MTTAGRTVVVVGGPTASGKSGLALDLAAALDGVIINADSIQVYRELRVLTARPGPADEARAPHRLFGVLPGSERCSAARWRAMALAEIAAAHAAGRTPIVVGGTGLYLKALMEGLAAVPEVPPEVRAATLALHRRLGGAAFHAALARRDPAAAARLPPGDAHRMIRAFEVVTATGRSIVDWRAEPGAPPDGLTFHAVALMPPRAPLYAAGDARFLVMIERGALAEVRALAASGLDPSLPVMKAVGVPELLAHLRGEISLPEAIVRAQRATRRYAKRQLTWFRHQWPGRSAALRTSRALEIRYAGQGVAELLAALRGA